MSAGMERSAPLQAQSQVSFPSSKTFQLLMWIQKLAGQSHIQYLLDPRNMDLGTVSELFSDQAMRAFDSHYFKLFNFSRHGAFSNLLIRWGIDSQAAPFPDRVLWQTVKCRKSHVAVHYECN